MQHPAASPLVLGGKSVGALPSRAPVGVTPSAAPSGVQPRVMQPRSPSTPAGAGAGAAASSRSASVSSCSTASRSPASRSPVLSPTSGDNRSRSPTVGAASPQSKATQQGEAAAAAAAARQSAPPLSLSAAVPPHRANTAAQFAYSTGLPIMFSAPHGIELYRRKAEGKRVIHKREQGTTELALMLAEALPKLLFPAAASADHAGVIPPASFVVWNAASARHRDPANTDPNYSLMADLPNLPWNAALRAFRAHCAECCVVDGKTVTAAAAAAAPAAAVGAAHQQQPRAPLLFPAGTVPLHIDIHGKIDRKEVFNLDVGLASMDYYMGRNPKLQPLCAALRAACAQHFAAAVSACPGKLRDKHTAAVEMNPYLSGFWGDATRDPTCPITMTTQAILLQIPSLQLEFPYAMRRMLMVDENFFAAVAKAVAAIFIEIQPPDSPWRRAAAGDASAVVDSLKRCAPGGANPVVLLGHQAAQGMLVDLTQNAVLRCEKEQI